VESPPTQPASQQPGVEGFVRVDKFFFYDFSQNLIYINRVFPKTRFYTVL
jgi:hypothetical protein